MARKPGVCPAGYAQHVVQRNSFYTDPKFPSGVALEKLQSDCYTITHNGIIRV